MKRVKTKQKHQLWSSHPLSLPQLDGRRCYQSTGECGRMLGRQLQRPNSTGWVGEDSVAVSTHMLMGHVLLQRHADWGLVREAHDGRLLLKVLL